MTSNNILSLVQTCMLKLGLSKIAKSRKSITLNHATLFLQSLMLSEKLFQKRLELKIKSGRQAHANEYNSQTPFIYLFIIHC